MIIRAIKLFFNCSVTGLLFMTRSPRARQADLPITAVSARIDQPMGVPARKALGICSIISVACRPILPVSSSSTRMPGP